MQFLHILTLYIFRQCSWCCLWCGHYEIHVYSVILHTQYAMCVHSDTLHIRYEIHVYSDTLHTQYLIYSDTLHTPL